MKIKYFYVLLVVFSFVFQVEGMFLEQTAVKATRCITRANVLSRGFKSVREKAYVTSEELPRRVNTTHFSSSVCPFQSLSGNYYQYAQSRKPSNWTLLAASGGALAALSYNKVFAKSEPQGDLREDELDEAFLTGYEKAQVIKKQKEVVFVLGNTGAGKSTFIARLMGAKTIEFKDAGGHKCVRITENPERYPTIGYDPFESKTFYPELWLADGLALCDSPGFKDTRGKNYQFVENVCLQYTVRAVKSKKFVIIIEEDTMTEGRGGSFKEFVAGISSLLTGEKVFNAAPGEKTSLHSIVWAITKVPSDRTIQEIRYTIKELDSWIQRRLHDLLKMVQGVNPELISQPVREKIERKTKERALLDSIGAHNTVLHFDKAKITAQIRGAQWLSAKNPRLIDSEQQQRLVNLSIKVFQEAISLDEETKKKIEEVEELSKAVQLKRRLQEIHRANPDNGKEDLRGIISERSEEARKKKEDCEKKYKELSDELRQLEQDKEEVLIWDFTHSQERSWGSINWSVFKFEYPSQKGPFTRVEEIKDENASLSRRIEAGIQGISQRTYKGGLGKNCSVTIKIYGEKNKLSDFEIVKRFKTDKLKEIEKETNELREVFIHLDRLKNEIMRGELEATKKFLSEKTSTASEEKLKELIRELEKKRGELEKKVKIGHALLEMGPDTLPNEPLAGPFLKQFKK